MRSVRLLAGILYYLSRIFSVMVLSITVYATATILLYEMNSSFSLPFRVLEDGSFKLFLPFTQTTFLLGDYTSSYLVSYLMMLAFYGLFLWLLADVFHAFKQPRLFTPKGVVRLTRFYLTNIIVPFVFIFLLIVFGNELLDIVRITLLHFVIGVFAYFIAAIFKQGLVLQEEQDLTL
ncbi:DUF2975 domain-containing protein [Flavisolibacter tropicus]|uniref:DUF2975 domain-containing protein n=1 Tax=Flavisolibacter tropicus TaxID=1492898 RepID=A0A172TRJ5_9BACT|nr:DUF2975 domain-containing protein [Flavisolibacter tropicus]ANE49618.1 hypothetical protein SY85_02955 [Flavisolibacter tropicus]